MGENTIQFLSLKTHKKTEIRIGFSTRGLGYFKKCLKVCYKE